LSNKTGVTMSVDVSSKKLEQEKGLRWFVDEKNFG
jgi:hypothetical protein